MKPASTIGVGGAIVLLLVLLLTTMSDQRAECRAVVQYQGNIDSAVASAATRPEAERRARETACGTLSSGMNDRIACANTPPASLTCRAL